MKKKYLLLILGLSTTTLLLAQQPTKLWYTVTPVWSNTALSSLEPAFDSYVQDRQKNDPYERGIHFGFGLEKPLGKSLSYQIGIDGAYYSMASKQNSPSEMQMVPNSNRTTYEEWHRFYFIRIPFDIRKDLWDYNIRKDLASEGKIYITAGVAPSWMLRNKYERKYSLEGGGKEVTENEFEIAFGNNTFRACLKTILG